MKRFYIIVFAIIAAALLILLIGQRFFFPEKKTVTGSKLIIAQANNGALNEENSADERLTQDESSLTSFIPLKSDETLIGCLSADINADSFEDQVIAVKNAQTPFITLIPGIYNPQTTVYERKEEITTEIAQVKTFTFTTLDITGEKINTLLYTGFTDNNESVMQAFNGISDKSGKFYMHRIIDLKTDGTVFIEDLPRSESYDLGFTKGESFAVWVYSTDNQGAQNSFDQIQTKYVWSPDHNEYIKQYETRVTGKKIAAKEVERILDGNPETFINFLDGLWYRTSGTNKETRYLFFDKKENDVIFLYESTQEIYTIINKTLRRSGIYMSLTNKSIQNLSRRIDVALLGTDEIRIKLTDDLRMVIKEETLWDGTYKKMSQKSLGQNTNQSTVTDFYKMLQSGKNPWYTSDGVKVEFDSTKIKIQSEKENTRALYSPVTIKNETLLQIRSESKTIPSGFYKVKRSSGNSDIATDVLELSPISVSTNGYFNTGKASIRLETIK